MTAPDSYRNAVAGQRYEDKPIETWLYQAKKVKPNKIFCVLGKKHLNTIKGEFETACVTTHRLSEAKRFAAYWAETLDMTDIKIFTCPLAWEEMDLEEAA